MYALENNNIKWRIRNYPNYGFKSDNNLYNLKTNRKLKKTINSRCIGYWFGKDFISLTKLKTLLYKDEDINIFKKYGLL